MNLTMYLTLLLGFVLLLKGAGWFVDAASALAQALHIPSLIIGLTIVAMGTSAPEAAVSITAAFSGSNEIALSNVVGSNMFNLLAVVGISSLLRPALVEPAVLRRDLFWHLGASLLLMFLAYSLYLGRLEGLLLLLLFAVYMFLLFKGARGGNENQDPQAEEIRLPKQLFWLVIGLAAVILGGNLVVNSATDIAKAWGLSETLIGLTIVAIGTSLPELATSVMAAYKGDSSLALGNVLGSNIFNILFILGLSCTLSPIAVLPGALVDIGLLCAVAAVTLFFCRNDGQISRREGAVLLGLYLLYTVWLICR